MIPLILRLKIESHKRINVLFLTGDKQFNNFDNVRFCKIVTFYTKTIFVIICFKWLVV